MEGLRPHAEALDIPEVEREERLYQVSSNYTPKVLFLQLFTCFTFTLSWHDSWLGPNCSRLSTGNLLLLQIPKITCAGNTYLLSWVRVLLEIWTPQKRLMFLYILRTTEFFVHSLLSTLRFTTMTLILPFSMNLQLWHIGIQFIIICLSCLSP